MKRSISSEKQVERLNADIRIGHFSERLKEAIGNESARSFAQKIGISGAAVRKYLAGESEPTRPVLIAMADEANVRVEWLATGEGPKEPESIKLTETAAYNSLRDRVAKGAGYSTWTNAEALGLPREKIRKYVNGHYLPTEEEIKILCEAANWEFETGKRYSAVKHEKKYEIEIAAEIVGYLDEVFIKKSLKLDLEKKKKLFILLMEKATSLGLSKGQIKSKIDEYLSVMEL